MNTQLRILLIVSTLCVVIVVAFGVSIYYFQNQFSYVDFYKRLETRARISAISTLEPDTVTAENLRAVRKKHLETLENEKEILIAITPEMSPEEIAKKYELPVAFVQELLVKGKSTDRDGSTFFAGSRYEKLGKAFLVVVSAENYYTSHHLIFLRNLIIGSAIFIVCIVILLSVYFSRSIFDPIRSITDRVKQISTESIHLRVETNTDNSAEITDLANTFNDLLSRIETAFETQKNFISNASHELGTPLTAIIGEGDVSLLKERSPDEYQKSITKILQQAERLDQITKSLLFLAQTGYKGKAIVFEMVRVDELIWEAKALMDKLNPSNHIIIDLSLLPEDPKKLKVKGNKQLLHLAIGNILTNACKYSANAPVHVHIASSDTHIIVTTRDTGIGIPAAEMPYIYDPFFRASNTGLFDGYGIGLPLTRNVVNLHKGSLLVTSVVNQGTTVQIKLPLM